MINNHKFQAGRYYVVINLKKGFDTTSIISKNHIYIMRMNSNTVFTPRLDNNASNKNYFPEQYMDLYREATENEIKRYRKLKKPFDVTDTSYIMGDIEEYLEILEAKFTEDEQKI